MISGELAREGTDAEFLAIGNRALTFQEFLIRRAWGLFYGVWAIDILMNLIGSFFLISAANLAFSLLTIVSGFFVSTEVFRKARNASTFRNVLSRDGRGRRGNLSSYFALGFVAYVSVILVLSLHFSGSALAGRLAGLSFLALVVLAGTLTFFASWRGLGKVVVENALASSTMILGGSVSFIVQSMFPSVGYEMLGWGMVIAAWIIAAMISLYSASDYLGEING